MNEDILLLTKDDNKYFLGKNQYVSQENRDILDLYIAGKNYKEIAEILGISKNAISLKLNKFRKQGLISKKVTKIEIVMDLIKIGITDSREIAKKLNVSCATASHFMTIANRRIKQEKTNLGVMPERAQNIDTISPDIFLQIKIALEYTYPNEIADAYNIPAREVYNILYGLSKEKKRTLKRNALKRNLLYGKIKSLMEKYNIKSQEALSMIEQTDLTLNEQVNLARIYYLGGNPIKAQSVLSRVIYNKNADINFRIMTRKESDSMYFNDIALKTRKDYISKKTTNGEFVCFNNLSKKYNVGYTFLTDVIGPEPIIDLNELCI